MKSALIVLAVALGTVTSASVEAQTGQNATVQELQAACDGGTAVACNNLGIRHFGGRGVPRDLARAAALYEKACAAGLGASCANVGLLYENGDGVALDKARAACCVARVLRDTPSDASGAVAAEQPDAEVPEESRP